MPRRSILKILDKANIRSVVFPLGTRITLLAQGRPWFRLFSRLHKRHRMIVQILIFQGTELLTIWFLDLGTIFLNDKSLRCSGDPFYFTFLHCFYLLFIATTEPTVGSTYCMSRFLFGIFCDAKRLTVRFSKQYLVISTKSPQNK